MLPSSLLVKPVSARCNLACRYCFYARRSSLYSPGRRVCMSDKVLEGMISQYLGISPGHASLSWQGGEPLLAGLDFYKRAVSLQEAHGRGHVVSNAFQTNGTLLSEDWAKFFRRYKFLVGISLDGPADLHNAYRRTRPGGPTFDVAMKGLSVLKQGHVEFNALCVVTDLSAGRWKDIYAFFAGEDIRYLQFVPCRERDAAGNAAPFNVGANQYGEFLCRMFDLWKADFPNVYIRLFNSVLATRLGGEGGFCTLGPRCAEYVVVEYNGDVYPCDFFVEKSMLLGNLMVASLAKIVESTALEEFARAKTRLAQECRDCPWLDLCFGGCQYHRPDLTHPSRSDLCASYRRFFEHSEEGFRELERRL